MITPAEAFALAVETEQNPLGRFERFAFIPVPDSHCSEPKTLTYFILRVCLLTAAGDTHPNMWWALPSHEGINLARWSNMESNVTDSAKVAFITGCASGIGEATALHFGAKGIAIVGCDLDTEKGEAVIQKVKAAGGLGVFTKADVSSEPDIEAAMALGIKRFGHIDYAVNNAGIEGVLVPFDQTKVEDFDHVVAVNLRGVFICMKHQLIHMKERNAGSIVNISSVMGMVGAPMIIQYVAAKHGVIGLTKSAAAEFARTNVKINAICPGGVETAMVRSILRDQPEALEPILAAIPAKRLAQTSEIAEAIYWVCVGSPGYLTGAAIPVDGAFTAV